MKTNRLSEKLTTALNEQISKEAHAAQNYLSYAAWAENNGFSDIANYLFRHTAKERNQMIKLFKYILKRGGKVKMTAIPAPVYDPVSVKNCFDKVFEHEVSNTKAIYTLLRLSHKEEDWSTWSFMQEIMKEQIEKENITISLLDKIDIAGGERTTVDALYLLNKDLETTPDDARLVQKVKTDISE